MQFLVICRPAEGGDPEDFNRLVPFETEVLRGLKADGTPVDAWSPGPPGAVLVLQATDADQAAQIMAELPLLQADLIATEIIPLNPIDLR